MRGFSYVYRNGVFYSNKEQEKLHLKNNYRIKYKRIDDWIVQRLCVDGNVIVSKKKYELIINNLNDLVGFENYKSKDSIDSDCIIIEVTKQGKENAKEKIAEISI